MSINQRGKSWEACFYHGDKRYRRSFKTAAEAETWERESKARLSLGQDVASGIAPTSKEGVLTLHRLFERIRETHWRGSKAEDTMSYNSGVVESIIGPSQPVSEIETKHVDLVIEQMKAKGNSNATINRKLATLKFALNYAHERGWINKLPVIKRFKENTGRLRFMTDEEETRVLDYFTRMGEQDMVDLVKWLTDTGMRLMEALNVRYEDVNLKVGSVVVWERKGGLPGGIPLTSRLLEIAKRRMIKDHPLFFPLSKRRAQFQWDLCRTHLGLEADTQFVLHCLRHTCASRLVQRAVPLYVVQKWLGHASITMTQRYAHLRPEDLIQARVALESPKPLGYTQVSGESVKQSDSQPVDVHVATTTHCGL